VSREKPMRRPTSFPPLKLSFSATSTELLHYSSVRLFLLSHVAGRHLKSTFSTAYGVFATHRGGNGPERLTALQKGFFWDRPGIFHWLV
jgi:hypothetical protein